MLEDKTVRRVAFHEITPGAVRDAMACPRELDMDLVRAQQARRALDYLVGFHLSALLWRKVRGGRSAGRVQSVALRLLCAREAEIETFEPEEYWTVEAAAMAERGGGFTEAGLVRRLEELGIGRPSTYAAIVGVLRERGYAVLYRRRFVPTERGRVVTAFLDTWFARWVAEGFTTRMEADLDRVAAGAVAGEAVLGAFWGDFDGALEHAGGLKREEVRAAVERALEVWLFGPAGRPEKRTCPSCAEGRLGLKLGRHGPFVGCARYPECRYTRPLARDPADDGAGPVALGTDPGTGLALTLRTGRYVQRGEVGKDPQAARGTVPMGMEAHEITPEVARALLALPRTVGTHPDTGKAILAGIGRYGPWLKHGAAYVALPEDEDVLTVGLNRAVMLVDTA